MEPNRLIVRQLCGRASMISHTEKATTSLWSARLFRPNSYNCAVDAGNWRPCSGQTLANFNNIDYRPHPERRLNSPGCGQHQDYLVFIVRIANTRAGVAEWQTRWIQNPVRVIPRAGSTPASGTRSKRRFPNESAKPRKTLVFTGLFSLRCFSVVVAADVFCPWLCPW